MPAINTDPTRFPVEGYCLFRDVFHARHVAAMQAHLDMAQRAGFCETEKYYGEPHVKEVFWLETCIAPRLLDAVESALGPNLILVYSSMFIKPARDDTSVAWHQDNTYWPSVHGTDVLTVWLAIDDVAEENAPMRVVPGSHADHKEFEKIKAKDKEWFNWKADVTDEMTQGAVSLTMSAGSLSIHDSFLIHGGVANRSDRRRTGYTIRFCSTDTAWVDLEKHPHSVYLVRGERGPRGKDYVDLRP
jgi:ectoine hydroxylase-related dioxygenase (phytanoyl-CoA dioxygenase family)